MRIVALHNIREPGLIPNGFQKEEAPPPSPDHAWQPDMRIRAKAMTDTRHLVEYLNPLMHLEVNAANRTATAERPALEMGRAKEGGSPTGEGAEKDAGFARQIAAYEQALGSLWEKVKASGEVFAAATQPKRQNAQPDYYYRRAVEAYSRQMQEKAENAPLFYEI